jgi:chromosome segregation ATPase
MFTPHHTESPRGVGGEDSGWETTCTQILFGINAHTTRIDELLERVSHQEQAVAALSAERNEASAEARVAQAQLQAQAQQLAACEGRISELLAVQQQQQLALQQHQKEAAEVAAHVRAQQTAAVQQVALQEQVRMLVGRLATLEGHRVSERLGEFERGLDERAKASEAALRRSLAELAPTSENMRGAKVAEEAMGVAHRCEAQMGMLRDEAAGWHRRLGQVEAECCRSLAAVDGLRDRLVVSEERARSGSQAAVQAAAVHVKTLGSDLMQELQGKAPAAEARRLGEQLHTLEGRHRSLEAEVEAVRGSRSEAGARGAREAAAKEAAAQACTAAEAVVRVRVRVRIKVRVGV